MTYVKRYAGGYHDLPLTDTPVDAQAMTDIQNALTTLFGVAPITNGAMIWDGSQFRADAKLTEAQVTAGTITNASINASAAIVGSKMLPVRVATTVAGLGTAADGALGRLRTGSTPFDFIDVIYDATYAKWVSPETTVVSIWSASTTSTILTAWPNAGGGNSNFNRFMKLKDSVNAGLTLQARMVGALFSSSADTCTVDLVTQTINVGGDYAAATTVGGAFSMSVAGTGRALKDSGWAAVTYDSGAKDYVILEPMIKTSAGTSNILVAHLLARWVG